MGGEASGGSTCLGILEKRKKNEEYATSNRIKED
jgi:hypothetical protein